MSPASWEPPVGFLAMALPDERAKSCTFSSRIAISDCADVEISVSQTACTIYLHFCCQRPDQMCECFFLSEIVHMKTNKEIQRTWFKIEAHEIIVFHNLRDTVL